MGLKWGEKILGHLKAHGSLCRPRSPPDSPCKACFLTPVAKGAHYPPPPPRETPPDSPNSLYTGLQGSLWPPKNLQKFRTKGFAMDHFREGDGRDTGD